MSLEKDLRFGQLQLRPATLPFNTCFSYETRVNCFVVLRNKVKLRKLYMCSYSFVLRNKAKLRKL